MKINYTNYSAKNKGFNLIEVMIASFILSLSLLGLAGMQSTAVKSAIEIQQRSLANSLITDITERMQLNKAWLIVSGNNYSITSLSNANLSKPSCVSESGHFVNCTGEDIKNNDLYEWKRKFTGSEINNSTLGENGLIQANACIAIKPISGSDDELAEIVISWFSTIESKDAAHASANNLTTTCGTSSASRRQLSVETYINKTS